MIAIDNKSLVNALLIPQNLLNANVSFAFTGGSGYTSAPTVSFSGGGGSGAAATANLVNGRVVSLTITAPGTGYTSAPTIGFSGGGGTGAAATVVLSGKGVADSVTVGTAGTGYTSAPLVSFTGGGGTGATGHAVLSSDGVGSVVVDTPGTGYTSNPTVVFDNAGTGGSGAAATATLTTQTVSGATITSGGTGDTVLLTDNTAYPAGDSRAMVQVLVADKFQGHKEHSFTGSSLTIDLLADGLNIVDGVEIAVTVVSTKGMIKDGSVHDVGVGKPNGNLIMEL